MKALTHRPPRRRAEARAFTLVELLVVIAIIAVAHKGIVRYLKPPLGDDISISYSYNWHGTIGYRGCPRAMYRLKLGLGHLSKDAAPEPQVLVPSEMYTIADARPVVGQAGLDGSPKMQLYGFGEAKEAPPPHAQGYNILFADGHVTFVKRSDYLCPPRTAHNWNRDNQPHPETWAPTDQWAAQN